VIAAAILTAMAAAADATNLCAVCHPDVRVQSERSIHVAEDVACVSCHGGDPGASSVAAAHRGRFRGKIRRREVPALCASCHSDADKMSPYNLSTDQYALYQTSHHGRALARGDEKAAVCTDCHGVHEILGSDDARSSAFVANIPETCARCHSDGALMSAYGLSGDPYADFVAGRHGEALLERQNASAPGCARCHGAHGATPPGVGDINKVCGQCHSTARAYFLESPHRLAMEEAGLPECASCHDHHRISKANVATLDTTCLECHEAGSEQVDLAVQMKTLYTSASGDLETARGVVDRAREIPLYVEDYEARLEEGYTSLVESLPAMHTVDLSVVEPLTERARSIGHEVESEVRSKLEGRRWRRVGLLVFWFYLIVTLGTLVRFRRRALRTTPR
jgi:predicted CXXCH cytochrome family protein